MGERSHYPPSIKRKGVFLFDRWKDSAKVIISAPSEDANELADHRRQENYKEQTTPI